MAKNGKKEWWEEKTTWTAILLIVTSILPLFVSLTPEMLNGIKTVIVGLALIFARQAIENTKK